MKKTPINSRKLRPTLADEQKIGFFRQDKVCQTDVSEILDLYDTMDTVEGLVEVNNSISIKKNILKFYIQRM